MARRRFFVDSIHNGHARISGDEHDAVIGDGLLDRGHVVVERGRGGDEFAVDQIGIELSHVSLRRAIVLSDSISSARCQRLVLVGALDEIHADGLRVRCLKRGFERNHAKLVQLAAQHDRFQRLG